MQSNHTRSGRIFVRLLAFMTASVAYSVLLCFVPETGWYSDVYPWAYQDVLESFIFWR